MNLRKTKPISRMNLINLCTKSNVVCPKFPTRHNDIIITHVHVVALTFCELDGEDTHEPSNKHGCGNIQCPNYDNFCPRWNQRGQTNYLREWLACN